MSSTVSCVIAAVVIYMVVICSRLIYIRLFKLNHKTFAKWDYWFITWMTVAQVKRHAFPEIGISVPHGVKGHRIKSVIDLDTV